MLIGTARMVIAGKETEGIRAAGIDTDALMKTVEDRSSESAASLFRGLRMRTAPRWTML